MKIENVDKCCECPFTNRFYEYEWSEYECEFGPEPTCKHDGEGRVIALVAETIKSNTDEPPSWCPLRVGEIVVRLAGGDDGQAQDV